MIEIENLILGAGLSGLSASFHLGHEKCFILEKKRNSFGLLKSTEARGYVWDQGPHVSFTKHNYVKETFAEFVDKKFIEQEAKRLNKWLISYSNH